MVVVGQVFFVILGFGQCLIDGDVDVFNCVMGIDMQIVVGLDFEVNQVMMGNLVEYVVEERYIGGKFVLVGVIEVEMY